MESDEGTAMTSKPGIPSEKLQDLLDASDEMMRSVFRRDRKATLNTVAYHVCKLLKAESCAIFLVADDAEDELVLESSFTKLHGYDLKECPRLKIRSVRRGGLTGHIAHKGKFVQLSRQEMQDSPYRAQPEKRHDHLISGICYSVLGIPLKDRKGRLVGLLKPENKTVRGKPGEGILFDDVDENLARVLANKAVAVIEDLRVFDSIRGLVKDIEGKRLPNEIVAAVVQRAEFLLRARPVNIALWNHSRKDLMLWSRLQDVGGITLNEAEPVPSEHFIREVWQQASRECRIDCSLALTPEEVASGNRARCSRIAAPLPSDGQKIGVVFAESSSLPGFDMQDAEVLEMLAHTAASAIKIMQIEKDYQLSATFFSSMVERLSQSVLCKDVDGHFTYVNERFAEKLGKSPSEIIGKTDHDIYDNKELADKYRNDDLKVIRTGLTMDMEEPNQPPGQERSDVRVIKSPIRNAAGKVIGVQGIFWDITERKRREREIAYMLANVPDNIYFKDRQSRFTRINKHLAQQFGLQNPDEAIGKTDFDFFTEEHARPAFEDEQKIIRTGESVVGKQEKETYKDGGLRYVLTTKLPLFDYQNHIIGTFGISKDIDQLVRTDEELKDALQKKGQLLQEAHHRIKGNLETISSLLFLEAERLNDETAKRALAESRGRVQTIAIIHRMLSRSASDSALVNCNYLSELVQMLMRAHQPIANNIKQDCEIQNIQLSFDAAVNCGLVVNELVSNSLRHAFPDRRPGAIRVCLQLGQDNAVFLVVADDGIGLPAQIDPATTNSLGLELVYRWATKGLGGTLEVNRQNGTIFKIRFPQSKQRSNQPAK